MLACQLTKKLIKSTTTTCTTLRNNDVSGDWYIFQQDSATAHGAWATVEFLERETPEFILPLPWPPNSPDLNPVDYRLQHEEHPAREGVQNTHHGSRRPQTSHHNWVGQAGSCRHCCSCASVASTSFSLCEGGRWSFRAPLLVLTSCRLIFRSGFLAVVSYDVVRFNTWRLFNLQGKAVTLIRCGGLLLC